MGAQPVDPKDVMHAQFRSRARGLRVTAFGILGLIFLLLVGGASAFVLAPQITLSDLYGSPNPDQKIADLTKELNRLGTERAKAVRDWSKAVKPIYDQYSSVLRKYGAEKNMGGVIIASLGAPVTPNLRIDLQKPGSDKETILNFLRDASGDVEIDVTNAPGGLDGPVYAIKHDNVAKLRDDLAAQSIPATPEKPAAMNTADREQLFSEAIKTLEAEKSQKALAEVLGRKDVADKVAGAIPSRIETPVAQLIQTNVTRFGTIIMITFLVSILTPLYRYNLRLASYYDARADVLELLKSDLKKVGFTDLAASLTPSLDFGKAPSTPVEQLIELARHLGGDRSKSSEKSGE